MKKRRRINILALILSIAAVLVMPSCQSAVNDFKQVVKDVFTSSESQESREGSDSKAAPSPAPGSNYDLSSIPDYDGIPYVEINNNVPFFDSSEYTTKAFESYSELDALGRCGAAYANVCKETMPTEKRGDISKVKPTGWQSVRYDFVDGKSLYNRCHLIGYQLTAENANEKNLITGTRYLNVDGMLPFENMIADYVKETKNHVLYRVTPLFEGDELVARGVEMEAYSVEDNGDGVSFNVYAYNVQPGVVIDYATGKSRLADESQASADEEQKTYVINTNNKKIHLPECKSAGSIKEENKKIYTGTLSSLISQGYTPCGSCLSQ